VLCDSGLGFAFRLVDFRLTNKKGKWVLSLLPPLWEYRKENVFYRERDPEISTNPGTEPYSQAATVVYALSDLLLLLWG
jgi:hypothetical protein